MKQFYILLIIIFSIFSSWAQVGIGTTTPNAQLDIKASNQSTPANNDGILIPKVDSFPMINPTALQDGMMVYLTTTAGPNQPGFYYWDNTTTSWKSVGGDKGWILNGNAGTTPISSYIAAPNENFIGTSDATDLSIGTNKIESIRIKQNIDKIGLFNNNPDYNLNLQTNVTGVILPRNGFRVKDIMGGAGAQKGSFFGFDHNNLNETLIWTYGNNENIFNDKSIRIGVGNETVNQTLAKFTYRSLGLFGDNPSYSLDIKTAPNDAIFHPARRNGIRINTPFSNSNTDYAGLFLGIKENGNFQDSNEAYIWNYGDGVATNSFLSFGAGPDTTTGEIMRMFKDKIGIGTTTPTNGAILDINSTTSGILIPRVFLSNVNTGGPIFVLTESLLVYNTNAFVLGGTGTGFYYWDNSKWVKIATDTSDKWSINGNSGTNSLTNFIGTIDDNDFVFRRNNLRAGLLGNTNTSLGVNSMPNTVIGTNNVAIGNETLKLGYWNTNGTTALGSYALSNNTTGLGNTATGFESLKNNSTGNYNTANGYQALANLFSGEGNSAFGNYSLSFGDGSYNTASGFEALMYNTGNLNTAMGYNSLLQNNSGTKNTALGANSLISNFTGSGNTAIGNDALKINTINSGLTAIGESALANNNYGNGNTATGFEALKNNTEGSYNTANGFHSLLLQFYGEGNSAFGNETLSSGDGSFNTATGNQALRYNLSNYNTAIGYNSLLQNSWGTKNTALGSNSLISNYTGNYNTAIGNDALSNSSTGSNNIGIGNNAQVTYPNSNDQLSIANVIYGTDLGSIYTGKIGIGINNPTYKLHIGDANSGLRVEGPSFASTGGASISAGGLGEIQIDKPGVVGGRLIVKENGNVGINNNNPSQSLDITGKIKITDGSEGAGKVLVSDATGAGTWTTTNSIKPAVVGEFAGGGGSPNSTTFVYCNTYIDLPPGKWMVFGTYLLAGSTTLPSGQSVFVRTNFQLSDTVTGANPYVISGGLISGVLAGPSDFGIANGQTIIQNPNPPGGASIRFYMWAGIQKYGPIPAAFSISGIGSSFWSENQLSAIPMN